MKTLFDSVISFLFPIAQAITLPLRGPEERMIELTTATPASALSNLYTFALGIGAMVSFGIIVYAAFRYTTTESSSVRHDAQSKIFQTLLGLLLLLMASVVLSFIDRSLPLLTDPNIQPLSVIGTTGNLPTGNTGTGNPSGGEGVPTGTAGAQCTPMESGPGSVSSLQAALLSKAPDKKSIAMIKRAWAGAAFANCFGSKIEKASGVVKVESGGNESIASNSDKCGNDAVSIGLFQINLTVNPLYDGNGRVLLNCPQAFQGRLNNLQSVCRVSNRDLYNRCVAAASDPRINTWSACVVFKQGGNSFRYWGGATKAKCGI